MRSAESEDDGVMLPSGIWWRTREPAIKGLAVYLAGAGAEEGAMVGYATGNIKLMRTSLMVEAREEDGLDRARRH